MDSQERDALREKHRDWSGHCPACDYQSHPCDVIKVLDAWEAEVHDGSEVSTTREVCDHAIFDGNAHDGMKLYGCPKCGGIAVGHA